jgi:hypothetical protein
MSTIYCFDKQILMRDLFDGRLAVDGITGHCIPDDPERGQSGCRYLTDGQNCLHVYGDEHVERLCRYGQNSPFYILNAIAQAFDTYYFSEHMPQYWGFDTEEELDEWHAALAKEERDEFYLQIQQFLAGLPSGIGEGTVGEIQAKIARKLVEEQPALALPEAKERLMDAIDVIYLRDHAIAFTLSDEQISYVEMVMAHSTELPQA